jgi:hypothetical protein
MKILPPLSFFALAILLSAVSALAESTNEATSYWAVPISQTNGSAINRYGVPFVAATSLRGRRRRQGFVRSHPLPPRISGLYKMGSALPQIYYRCFGARMDVKLVVYVPYMNAQRIYANLQVGGNLFVKRTICQ